MRIHHATEVGAARRVARREFQAGAREGVASEISGTRIDQLDYSVDAIETIDGVDCVELAAYTETANAGHELVPRSFSAYTYVSLRRPIVTGAPVPQGHEVPMMRRTAVTLVVVASIWGAAWGDSYREPSCMDTGDPRAPLGAGWPYCSAWMEPAFPAEWFDRDGADRIQAEVRVHLRDMRGEPRELGLMPPTVLAHRLIVAVPEYTTTTRGRVVLQGRVKVNGRLGSIKAISAPSRSLRKLAIETAGDARFKPATLDGKPVGVPVYLVVEIL